MAPSKAFALTRGQYSADFKVVPILIVAALGAVLWSDGPSLALLGSVAAGGVAWILSEWMTHKFLFHRLYRREHWTHHLRPTSDIGVPPLYTMPVQIGLGLGLPAALGLTIGGGLFVGYAAGYLAYICVHHVFHRYAIPQGHWLRKSYERHEWHHRGNEVNFNVLFPLADRLFGTYYQPPPGAVS